MGSVSTTITFVTATSLTFRIVAWYCGGAPAGGVAHPRPGDERRIRSPCTYFVPRSSVSDVTATSAVRWSAVARLSEVSSVMFWRLAGGASGATSVFRQRARRALGQDEAAARSR